MVIFSSLFVKTDKVSNLLYAGLYWPRREKIRFQGFRPSNTKTSLLSELDKLQYSSFTCICSSLCTFQRANNKDADQTVRIRRLVSDFVVPMQQTQVLFVTKPM